MRKGARFVRALLVVVLFAVPGSVGFAEDYVGCFVCEYEYITGISTICDQVGDGESGLGWHCKETQDLVGSKCQVSGGLCYNITVDGGGGGGGGGGGDTCERGPGGVCPAECFSCGSSGGGGIITL
jgi:hypothetical protein